MKKSYSKPQIMFESFALSTNIAVGCNLVDVTPVAKENGCGLIISDRVNSGVLFNQDFGCTITGDDGSYNTICYHNPDGYADVIFTS